MRRAHGAGRTTSRGSAFLLPLDKKAQDGGAGPTTHASFQVKPTNLFASSQCA